jgi:O-methyltransferase domain
MPAGPERDPHDAIPQAAIAADGVPQDVSRATMPRRPPTPIVRGALRLRRTLLALADKVVPPQFALFDQAVGDGRARAIAVMTQLGITDLLGSRSRTAQDLAKELGLDADLLHRTMRALVLEGVFRLSRSGKFSLTAKGHRLRSDHPDSLRSWILYWSSESNQRAWAAFDTVLRTGEPSFRTVHGKSVWTWFDEHPDEGRTFAAAMRRLTEFDAPDIVGLYPWPATGTVCDVAGGAGTLLSRVLQANPELRGVLVEAPIVLAEAEHVLTERGVRDRVELVEGDLFGTIIATADIYLLKTVLHDWDDDTCLRILRTVYEAMPPGATVVVIEYLQEPNVASYPASMNDLQMAVICDRGRERSRVELQGLLGRAGFTPTTVHVSGSGLGLTAGTR